MPKGGRRKRHEAGDGHVAPAPAPAGAASTPPAQAAQGEGARPVAVQSVKGSGPVHPATKPGTAQATSQAVKKAVTWRLARP